MIVNIKFVHFHQISLIFVFVNTTSKFFCAILVSLKFYKFQSRNSKSMAKDVKIKKYLPKHFFFQDGKER
jgi:hypothetical protein